MEEPLAAFESDKANGIPDIELKYVAAIVEGLVTVGGPHDSLQVKHFSKPHMGNIKVALFRPVGVDRIAKRVGDFSGIRFSPKRHVVSAAHGNARFDFIERAGEQGAIGKTPTV